MKQVDIETIKELSVSGRIQWSSHALVRIFQRIITAYKPDRKMWDESLKQRRDR